MLSTHTDVEPVIIGLFPNASDARLAMKALREHNFSAQEIPAASREPGPVEVAPGSLTPRSSGQWFGQLRQLYHAERSQLRGSSSPGSPNRIRVNSWPTRSHTARYAAFGPRWLHRHRQGGPSHRGGANSTGGARSPHRARPKFENTGGNSPRPGARSQFRSLHHSAAG